MTLPTNRPFHFLSFYSGILHVMHFSLSLKRTRTYTWETELYVCVSFFFYDEKLSQSRPCNSSLHPIQIYRVGGPDSGLKRKNRSTGTRLCARVDLMIITMYTPSHHCAALLSNNDISIYPVLITRPTLLEVSCYL